MERIDPKTQRMLDFIRTYGYASRADLRDVLGYKASTITSRLQPHIDKKLISVEHKRNHEGSGIGGIYYRWVGERRAQPGPRDPDVRECLKCRNDFHSAHAGNRLCPRCSHVEVSPYALAGA